MWLFFFEAPPVFRTEQWIDWWQCAKCNKHKYWEGVLEVDLVCTCDEPSFKKTQIRKDPTVMEFNGEMARWKNGWWGWLQRMAQFSVDPKSLAWHLKCEESQVAEILGLDQPIEEMDKAELAKVALNHLERTRSFVRRSC